MRPKRHRIELGATQRARKLRRESTIPEKLLWGRLRAGQIRGLRFRRQEAIDSHIVDFYCPTAKLVVELDGMSHDHTPCYDAKRTNALVALGLRVVRYTNDEVLRDLDAVVDDIHRHLTNPAQ